MASSSTSPSSSTHHDAPDSTPNKPLRPDIEAEPQGHDEDDDDDNTNEPGLADLVEILLVSKRSLASINLVWRAREIVDASRQAVEENAVLAARNAFVGRAVSQQMDVLDGIRYGVRVIEEDGGAGLKDITEALDKASGMLDTTLESLREITVDAAFRPAGEEGKCLFDFVDESGVEDLYESIRESIDRCDSARQTLVATYTSFDQDLALIMQSLRGEKDDEAYTMEEESSPVTELFYSLEQDATSCAENLQGLVKHYDLCVTALKHTEGGGDVITKYSENENNQDQNKLAGFGLGITTANEETPKALSAEDQAEMLRVLVRDASEVDEVVSEIQDRLVEMEENYSMVQSYIDLLRSTSQRHAKALVSIKRVAGNVPAYISACAEFQSQWEEEQENLVEKIEEIEQLQEFYTGFAAGYDNLVLEVQRRKQALREMEKVARHAMSQIEKMHKVEIATREEFRSELGEYLPNDIWPGLIDPPTRFEISAVSGDDAAALPDLTREVVQNAMQRLKARTANV